MKASNTGWRAGFERFNIQGRVAAETQTASAPEREKSLTAMVAPARDALLWGAADEAQHPWALVGAGSCDIHSIVRRQAGQVARLSSARGLPTAHNSYEEFDMQSRIVGTTMPVLEVSLNPGEAVVSEAGELSWMTSSIQMTTHTQFGGGGGFFGALKRVAGGGSLFMTQYQAGGAPGTVSFATKLPGHIVPVEVAPGQEYLIHRHGFLCGTPQIQISVGFQQSLGAGIFGGEGYLLQRVSGTGTAWLELSGELVMKELQPGENLRVHPGHVGAFQAGVSFQITTVPGIKNMLFGGDGIFLASLTGPGKIWLQTLPIARLAHELIEYMPTQSREAAEGGVIGGIMGSILNNR